MYDPQDTIELDFEGFFDKVKKGFKKVGDITSKVTEATITKPSAMIGKLIGGKKGEAIGRKLGGFTAKVTNFGVKAGVGGAVAPLALSPTVLTTAGTALAGKKIIGKLSAKSKSKPTVKVTKPSVSVAARGSIFSGIKNKPKCSSDKDQAALVAALLVKKLGGSLSQANKSLRLAELQRQATYEHRKLMSDSEFRKRVLTGIAAAAKAGNVDCQKTIRVIVGR